MVRDTPYALEKADSVRRKMELASRSPERFEDLLAWFIHDFNLEPPGRLHERGVEPESALGSPKLAGAFRAYITASPLATDHNDALDATTRGAARLWPVHAALALMNRKDPDGARWLFLVAWAHGDWEAVALGMRCLPSHGKRITRDALRELRRRWERDAVDVARELQ